MSELTPKLAPAVHQRARDHHAGITLPHLRWGLISRQVIEGSEKFTLYVDSNQEHCQEVAAVIQEHAAAQGEEPVEFIVAPIFEMPE